MLGIRVKCKISLPLTICSGRLDGRAVRQLMTNLERIQAKARELARSGKFHGWRPIAFALKFENSGFTVQRFRMKSIASAKELGHQKTKLHRHPRARSSKNSLTQSSRSDDRRKTARNRPDVHRAGPIAFRIAQRRNHGASALLV